MRRQAETNGKNSNENKYDDIPSVQRISLTRKDAVKYINTCVIEAAFLQFEKGNIGYRGRITTTH